MSEEETKRTRRWPRRIFKIFLALIAVLVLGFTALVIALSLGWFDAPIRNAVVGQIERVTGGRVELGHFHFSPFSLSVEVQNLTVHGLEPSGTPPLFHADTLTAVIQVDSFWHKSMCASTRMAHRMCQGHARRRQIKSRCVCVYLNLPFVICNWTTERCCTTTCARRLSLKEVILISRWIGECHKGRRFILVSSAGNNLRVPRVAIFRRRLIFR
jgi:hypothetical protein